MMDTQKFWVVAADMGYGHLRAAWPFADHAEEQIISIGSDEYTSPKVKRQWSRIQGIYEFISRNKNLPFIGKHVFQMMNQMFKIPAFYPPKDRSHPTFQVKMLEKYIRDGLYDDMIQKVKSKRLPLLTTFYAAAIAADYYGYDPIYCVITDTDANRVWVAKDPSKSRIRYLVPSRIAYSRLLQYGVPEQNIYYTGFPISDTLIGGRDATVLKRCLAKRLRLLDPNGEFHKNFADSVNRILGSENDRVEIDRELTLTCAVGGAGAQKEMAARMAVGLQKELDDHKIKLNLIAGTRPEVQDYFAKLVERHHLDNVSIIFAESKAEYFDRFDQTILHSDILWTKPSELTFYAGLGIAVVLSPTIGAQEVANKRWLRDDIGAGIVQRKPEYCSQWLQDYLESGRLAEAAWLGYLKVEKMGYHRILEIIDQFRCNRSAKYMPLCRGGGA